MVVRTAGQRWTAENDRMNIIKISFPFENLTMADVSRGGGGARSVYYSVAKAEERKKKNKNGMRD